MAMLRFLARQGGDLALNDFAKPLGIHKSSAHRLLASMQDAGLIGRDPTTGRYQLGLELVALSGSVLGRIEVLRIADPHLRRLADLTRLTVNLALRHQHEVINIEQIPGPNVLRSFDWLGKRSPLHLGAAAGALLANLTDQEIDTYIDAAKLDPERLWQQVREIRQHGFAVNRGELDPEVYAVGAPIFNAAGRALASIAIAGYRHELTEARLEELAERVVETAETVSRQLGYPIQRVARMA
jgi:IclR family acetate operon transcriptional repressor